MRKDHGSCSGGVKDSGCEAEGGRGREDTRWVWVDRGKVEGSQVNRSASREDMVTGHVEAIIIPAKSDWRRKLWSTGLPDVDSLHRHDEFPRR
jgi:hypothetical protein